MSLNNLPDQPDQGNDVTMSYFRQQWATLVRTINPIVTAVTSATTPASSTGGTTPTPPPPAITPSRTDVTSQRQFSGVYLNSGTTMLRCYVFFFCGGETSGTVAAQAGTDATTLSSIGSVSLNSHGVSSNVNGEISFEVEPNEYYKVIFDVSMVLAQWFECVG